MADDPQPRGRRWNLFARELEDILQAHGARLAQIGARTSINPAKVSRLQASLAQEHPKQLPLLPQSEIDEIIHAFGLTPQERLRLHAAVLATAVERVLMGRLDAEHALLAAEQLYPVVLDTLRIHAGSRRGIGLYAQASDPE